MSHTICIDLGRLLCYYGVIRRLYNLILSLHSTSMYMFKYFYNKWRNPLAFGKKQKF